MSKEKRRAASIMAAPILQNLTHTTFYLGGSRLEGMKRAVIGIAVAQTDNAADTSITRFNA